MVEPEVEFIAAAGEQLTMTDQLRHRASSGVNDQPQFEVMLISSPGFGVLDSGCGQTIIGRETLKEFSTLWDQQGIVIPEKVHQFRFGNGQVALCVFPSGLLEERYDSEGHREWRHTTADQPRCPEVTPCIIGFSQGSVASV